MSVQPVIFFGKLTQNKTLILPKSVQLSLYQFVLLYVNGPMSDLILRLQPHCDGLLLFQIGSGRCSGRFQIGNAKE